MLQSISIDNVFNVLILVGCLFVHYLAVIKSIGKLGERITKIETEQEVVHKIIDRDFLALSKEVKSISLKCKYKSLNEINEVDAN